jgi:hypothetical protein
VRELLTDTERVLPCVEWGPDGKSAFCVTSDGLVRRVGLAGEEKRADLGGKCAWLGRSAVGLVATLPSSGEVVLIAPDTLAVSKRLPIASPARAVTAPGLEVAVVAGPEGRSRDAFLVVLDLKTGKLVGGLTSKTAPRSVALSSPVMTADGRHVLTNDHGHLCRIRLEGTFLAFEEAGPSLGSGRQLGTCVSPDGALVCVPVGGGSAPVPGQANLPSYSTNVFPVTNLSQSAFVLQSGAYPLAVGFDPRAGRVYGQNHDKQLIVFDGRGNKLSEHVLPGGGESRQFLAHPHGKKVLVLTSRKLLFVELPE